MQAAMMFTAMLLGSYTWEPVKDTPEEALRKDGVHVGSWCHDRKLYLPIVNNEWGQPCNPPIAPPVRPGWQTHGVDLDKLEAPKYTLNGAAITKEEATEIASKGIPDDTKKLRVTIIGKTDSRKLAEQEIKAMPSASKTAIWGASPDHWWLSRNGYVTSGSPTVYLQSPSGTVLHRQDDYKAGDFKVIEQAVANYDPSKDPDLRRPQQGNTLLILAALAGAYMYFRRENGTVSHDE